MTGSTRADHRAGQTGPSDFGTDGRRGQTPLYHDRPVDLRGAPMTTAVIVDAIRTPLGKRNGKLKEIGRAHV